jgi:hypothetical protein
VKPQVSTRSRVAMLATAAIAAGLLPSLPASAQVASGGEEDAFRHLADSRDIDGSVIVEGAIRSVDGSRPVGDAVVLLYAYPNIDDRVAALDGVELDYELAITPLARTTSGADGAFVLRVEPTHQFARLSSADGIVDAAVHVQSVDGLAHFAFSILADGSPEPGTTAEMLAEDVSLVALADYELGIATRAIEMELRLLADTTPDDIAPMASGACPNGKRYQHWDLGKRRVQVGEVQIAANGIRGRFIYEAGASSRLGVGVSFSGATGGFSQQGHISRSSTLQATSSWYKGTTRQAQDTEFRYSRECIAASDLNGNLYHWYEVFAANHAGGRYPRTVSQPSTPLSYCVFYPKGDYAKHTGSTAHTWTSGAKLNTVIGIDLSSRTGFTNSATVHFHMQDSSGRLCGTHGDPGGTPRRLVARYF